MTARGLVDLAGGTLQVLFVDTAGALPHFWTGKLRPPAVGGRERSALIAGETAAAEVGSS